MTKDQEGHYTIKGSIQEQDILLVNIHAPNMCVYQLLNCIQLCDPMDYSPSGSSVHGILQAIKLEWVAILFPRGSSQSRNRTWVSSITGGLYCLSHQGSPCTQYSTVLFLDGMFYRQLLCPSGIMYHLKAIVSLLISV